MQPPRRDFIAGIMSRMRQNLKDREHAYPRDRRSCKSELKNPLDRIPKLLMPSRTPSSENAQVAARKRTDGQARETDGEAQECKVHEPAEAPRSVFAPNRLSGLSSG